MTKIKEQLFQAFREDHARLGNSLHELGEVLIGRDVSAAQRVAHRLAKEDGAHFAFEEADFYPALEPFLSPEEVSVMMQEHESTRELLRQVLALRDGALESAPKLQQRLIDAVHAAQTHVAQCGELFGAMGGLDEDAQRDLLDKLKHWRTAAPNLLD